MARDPQTPAEWQEALDAATALRAIADCMMYGLVQGGPTINVERCDDLIARARRLRFRPSAPAADLAVAYIEQLNHAEHEARQNARLANRSIVNIR